MIHAARKTPAAGQPEPARHRTGLAGWRIGRRGQRIRIGGPDVVCACGSNIAICQGWMPTTLATQPVEPHADAMRTAASKKVPASSSRPPHCRGCTARNISALVSHPITSWRSCRVVRPRRHVPGLRAAARRCRAETRPDRGCVTRVLSERWTSEIPCWLFRGGAGRQRCCTRATDHRVASAAGIPVQNARRSNADVGNSVIGSAARQSPGEGARHSRETASLRSQ